MSSHLDKDDNVAPNSFNVSLAEHSSACWQTNDRVLVGASVVPESPEEVVETGAHELRLRPQGIAVYEVSSRSYVKSVVLDEVAGTMMPLGANHAICFFKHPRIVSLYSGTTIAKWNDLDTGTQIDSITDNIKLPPLALDPENRRFAVAGKDEITVIQIDEFPDDRDRSC